jgi:hypothetical protein
MENKFFISSFKEAAKNTMFQHRWMPVKTWSSLINHYYKPPINLSCEGTKLLNAVTHTKWFNTAIETTGVIDDELAFIEIGIDLKGESKSTAFMQLQME